MRAAGMKVEALESFDHAINITPDFEDA